MNVIRWRDSSEPRQLGDRLILLVSGYGAQISFGRALGEGKVMVFSTTACEGHIYEENQIHAWIPESDLLDLKMPGGLRLLFDLPYPFLNTRVTKISRDDGINAIEWQDNRWVLQDTHSPVKFYNFDTNSWIVTHSIDTHMPAMNSFVRDQETVLQALKTVQAY